MSLQNLVTEITLDVYDHDKTQTTIKAIALDDNSRYINARLTYKGMTYSVDPESTVTLTVLRSDKVGVSITGSVYSYQGEENDSYGASAELDQAALVKSGALFGQFKIISGTQLLRTEVFKINNGKALDAETSEWAGEYQGYDLDEFAQTIANTVERQNAIESQIDVYDNEIEEINEQLTELDGRVDTLNEGGLVLKDEVIQAEIDEWLNEHPEAVTTIQDGAVSTAKIANKAVTKTKLADGVTELFDGTGFYDEVTVTTGTYTNADGNTTNYYLATVPKYDADGNQIDIYAGYDTTKTPLTYAQANLTTLTANTSLDLAGGEKPAVIAGGELVRESTFAPAISSYPFVVYVGFDADRVPHEYPVDTSPATMINDGIINATAAFFRLVTDGVARDVSNIGLSAAALKVNPRMAMFTKSDGSICFLACDGRENVDEGLTPSELAGLMIDLGAVQGWNLDGGGSTSMVTCGSKINRNIDGNGTRDRGIRVTWNVGHKYSNPATQEAIAHVGIEKQRLIQQLETYFSDAAVPVQNGKDPTDLDGGIYYINNATNVPTSVDDGFVQVFKKYGASGIRKIYWYPYNSDICYEKYYDGSSWGSWVKLDPTEMWRYGPSITSGSNFNSYTTAGKYRVLNASAASGISNIPVQSPGALYVVELNQASVVLQMYLTGNGKMYTRRIITSTSTFEDWTLYAEVRSLTASYTTDANGKITFSVSVSAAEVLSMSADGYIVIPYKDGTAWKGLVLSTALQPIANSSVSVTTNYTLSALINDVSS